MAKGDICEAYGEWDDGEGVFRVYLVREDDDGLPDLDGAKPMLHGLAAQATCMMAGAKRAPQFSIDNFRGKIHGA